MPEAEKQLEAHLGTQFSFLQWKPAFNEIFKAKDDIGAAVSVIEALKQKATHPTASKAAMATPTTQNCASLPELDCLETKLMEAVDNLYQRYHAPNTFGTVNMEHTIDLSLSWSER